MTNDMEREIQEAIDKEVQPAASAQQQVSPFPKERQQPRPLPEQFAQMERIGLNLKESIIRSVNRMKADYEATKMELHIKYNRDVLALDKQLELDLAVVERDFRSKLEDLQRMADKL
jgi:hypothetical protein